MNKDDKPTRGIDWAAIFERRPELTPPGFEEASARLRARYNRDSTPAYDENAR